MCVGYWAGVTYLRYTVLTSPNKDETAVHCCDPALSVLVMLVSRNVFHVVSALHAIVLIDKLLLRHSVYENDFLTFIIIFSDVLGVCHATGLNSQKETD